jgi:fatty-acyl-CoA synthase
MLLEDLERHAALRGEKPCLVHRDKGRSKVLTFSDFAAISNRLAGAVRRLARRESSDVVLIIVKHHVLQLPLFVACMKAGLIPCFLPFPSVKQDPVLYWKTHDEVMTRSDPALVVTYAELLLPLRAIVGPSGAPVVDICALEGEFVPLKVRDADEVALLQHSSGTTGLKKGVALTYRQIARQVSSYAAVAGLEPESIVASWLPFYHDMGLFTAFLIPLSIGATIVSMDAFEWVLRPESLLETIDEFRATHCWLPNFAFAHILATTPKDRRFDLSSLRALVSCSEPVRASTLESFFERFGSSGLDAKSLKACYAMAETCFAVSQTPLDERPRIGWYDKANIERHRRAIALREGEAGAYPYVSNGPPIEGIEIRILTEGSELVPDPSPGVPVGEIAVRGAFLFQNYFANSEATKAAFAGDWYRTGDIGFIDAGEIFVSGRHKDVLIVHGRNYHAHDIEAAAGSVESIIAGRVVALGIVNEAIGSEEALVLAETDAAPEQHQALRREIKRRIYGALELTPHKIVFVSRGTLVKTTSGKISRSENLVRYLTGRLETEDLRE